MKWVDKVLFSTHTPYAVLAAWVCLALLWQHVV